jgi:hypothetical protein
MKSGAMPPWSGPSLGFGFWWVVDADGFFIFNEFFGRKPASAKEKKEKEGEGGKRKMATEARRKQKKVLDP